MLTDVFRCELSLNLRGCSGAEVPVRAVPAAVRHQARAQQPRAPRPPAPAARLRLPHLPQEVLRPVHSSDTPTFYLNVFTMRNTADVTSHRRLIAVHLSFIIIQMLTLEISLMLNNTTEAAACRVRYTYI
jgi:hypothetical protein